ncbi:MAG: tetratricopeptide repeat protein [Kiritimatiellae bacterium]|nr:tetratricopeptide repeat protein [Kiritimatiellia bacterium]
MTRAGLNIWKGCTVMRVMCLGLVWVLLAQAPAMAQSEMSDHLQRGQAALADGLYGIAEEHFQSYFKMLEGDASDNVKPVILLVRALHGQKKYAEILELLKVKQRWIGKATDVGAFSFWRAFSLFQMDEAKQGLAELEAFETRFPKDEYVCRARRLRTTCLLALKRTDAALTEFEHFDRDCAQSPEVAANLLDWGRVLVQENRTAEAVGILQKLLTIQGDAQVVQEGHLWMGRALQRAGKFAEATTVLEGLCHDETAEPNLRAEAYFSASDILAVAGDITNAVSALTNGVALARGETVKLRGEGLLGLMYLRMGRIDDGLTRVKAFTSALPDDALASGMQLKLATSLLDAERYVEALAEFQNYLETFDDIIGQAEASAGKGWALLATGRHAEAAGMFEKAYALHTDSKARVRCLFKAGDSFFLNEQYQLARDKYRQVYETFPESDLADRARLQEGVSLLRADDLDGALSVFNALSHTASDATVAEEALFRIAMVQEMKGFWLQAADGYSAVMKAHPSGSFYAKALHGRGLVRYGQYEFDHAAEDFERVWTEFQDSSVAEQAFYMRGLSYYGQMRDEKAIEICREFVERFPASRWLPEVLFWIGKYEYNRTQYAAAEKMFLKVVSGESSVPLGDDALLWSGLSAMKAKEYVRAIEHFGRLVKDYPESRRLGEARFHQADALCEQARFSAAILIFDEIISSYPEHELIPAAWGRKGDCQFTLGAGDASRYEESIASYRVVAQSETSRHDLIMQANYKIGRCLEKMGRQKEALSHYYNEVILQYFEDREKGVWQDQFSKVWFTRAAFNAADIMEGNKDWRGVVSILERVMEARVPAADEASERIEKIKAERWWLF